MCAALEPWTGHGPVAAVDAATKGAAEQARAAADANPGDPELAARAAAAEEAAKGLSVGDMLLLADGAIHVSWAVSKG